VRQQALLAIGTVVGPLSAPCRLLATLPTTCSTCWPLPLLPASSALTAYVPCWPLPVLQQPALFEAICPLLAFACAASNLHSWRQSAPCWPLPVLPATCTLEAIFPLLAFGIAAVAQAYLLRLFRANLRFAHLKAALGTCASLDLLPGSCQCACLLHVKHADAKLLRSSQARLPSTEGSYLVIWCRLCRCWKDQ